MKILYVITKSELGGAQAHVLQLIKEAHSRNIPTHLVVGELGWLSEKAKEFTTVTHLPSLIREISPLKDMLAVAGLVKIIKEEWPHPIQCFIIDAISKRECKILIRYTSTNKCDLDHIL